MGVFLKMLISSDLFYFLHLVHDNF